MVFLARLMTCALFCSFLVAAPAMAADTPSQGVEMLRAAMEDSASPAERDQAIRAALPILRRDAIAGNAKAQYNLARLYEVGVPSGPNSTLVTFPARSYAWYVSAARLGHPLAIKRLAASRSIEVDKETPAADIPEAAPAPMEKETPAPEIGGDKTYQLTVASFRNRQNATALVEILAEEGVLATTHRKRSDESGEWHIVQSAPLFSRREAEALKQGLKRNFGVDPIVREVEPALMTAP